MPKVLLSRWVNLTKYLAFSSVDFLLECKHYQASDSACLAEIITQWKTNEIRVHKSRPINQRWLLRRQVRIECSIQQKVFCSSHCKNMHIHDPIRVSNAVWGRGCHALGGHCKQFCWIKISLSVFEARKHWDDSRSSLLYCLQNGWQCGTHALRRT